MIKASCSLNKYPISSSMTIFFQQGCAGLPRDDYPEKLLTDDAQCRENMLDPVGKMHDY